MARLAIADQLLSRPARLDPMPATRRLAQVIAEVLTGARPAAQLSDVAAPDVIRMLVRSAGRLRAVPGAPVLCPIVCTVHIDEPAPGVAEACALINLGVRYRAIAFRMEAAGDDRWRCTALHIG
ncbi:MAG: hypothetical protein JO246_15670 [Frankiaceae bacterium]|nr:hypothetical protein [Frankiaceae bacterium]MBV9872770.1 hypothetical protein [Frankiaceae bacterium]